MTESNIELHTAMVEAVRSRAVPEEVLAPTFVMVNRASTVTDRVYRGAMGWRDWMDDLFEEFSEDASYELDELLAATDELVVASYHVTGTSVRSERPLEFRWVDVTWFHHRRAIHAIAHSARSRALEAARLFPAARRRESHAGRLRAQSRVATASAFARR
jgi:SnoaL-like domain